MTWAKIDDQFHAHRKAKRAWKGHPRALGLHMLAVSYCAGHLTDGLVDDEFVEEKIPAARERAGATAALVTAGLWEREEDGWRINDWLDYNPSREDVLEKRRRDAERKAAARARGVQEESDARPRGHAEDSEPRPDDPSRAHAFPDPTRPDPTTPEDNTEQARERAGSRRRIFDAWIEATDRTDRTVLDPKRRKLIDKALDAYPEQDVLDAVKGWRHSPHHCGQNDTGTVYNDLGLLLRDPGNIERFRDLERRPPTPIRPNPSGGWTAADMIAIGKETA